MSAPTVMPFFSFDHLPEGSPMRWVSQAVADLAHELAERLDDGPEKSAGMRKLLEAKDCFVRATLVFEAGPRLVEAAFVGGPIAGQSRQVPADCPAEIPVTDAPDPWRGSYRLLPMSAEDPDQVPTYSWVPALHLPGGAG